MKTQPFKENNFNNNVEIIGHNNNIVPIKDYKCVKNRDSRRDKKLMEQAYNMLYPNKDGFVRVDNFTTSTNKAKNVPMSVLMAELQKERNKKERFIGLNTLAVSWIPKGKHDKKGRLKSYTDYVRYLNAILIDIDYHNVDSLKNLTAWQVYGLIKEEVNLLEPSLVVDSGQGLHLYYCLPENTRMDWTNRKQYTKVAKTIVNELKQFGADPMCTDIARQVRIIGSRNAGSNTNVKVIEINNVKYTLEQLEEWYGEPTEHEEKENKPKRNVSINSVRELSKYKKTIVSLNHARARDIRNLIYIRQGECVGCREQIIHLYSVFLNGIPNISDIDKIEKCLELNNSFKSPLSRREVLNNIHHTNYSYSNESIIEKLGICEEEQKQLGTIIDKKEKLRRKREHYKNNKKEICHKERERYKIKLKEQGKQSKKEQTEELLYKLELLVSGQASNKFIMQQLSITESKLHRLKRKLKNRDKDIDKNKKAN